jgi:hypothetical protein
VPTTEVSAHSAGHEEVLRVWPFNAAERLDPDVREILSMHCSWCVLDCGEPHYEYSKSLTYEFLLREACGKSDIKDAHCEAAGLLEVYLFETIIARMLVAMNAKQRHDFLTRRVQLDVMAAGFPSAGWSGPMTTLAALSAAQASGFGVYMGATTALGLASHAVGVTLPFAVYAGMTSTIAFLIGPVGFLATAGWLAHVLTSPEWARIIRGLLHIIAMRAKYEYSTPLLLPK